MGKTSIPGGLGQTSLGQGLLDKKDLQTIPLSKLTFAGRQNIEPAETGPAITPEIPQTGDIMDFIKREEPSPEVQALQATTALTPPNYAVEQDPASKQREAERVPSIAERFGYGTFGELQRALVELDNDSPVLGAFDRAENTTKVPIAGGTIRNLELQTLQATSAYNPDTGQVRPNLTAALTATDRKAVAMKLGLIDKNSTKEEVQEAILGIELDKKIDRNKESETFGEIITKKPEVPLFENDYLNTTNPSIFFHENLLDAGIEKGDGTIVLDPNFLRIMSLATEAFLMNSMFTSKDEDVIISEPDERGMRTKEYSLTKSDNNIQLGREVFQAWKRQQAQDAGLPTDTYLNTFNEIPNTVFTHIGDLAKEVYSEANDNILAPGPKRGQQNTFIIPPAGIETLTKLHKANWGLFNNPEIKPMVAPSDTGKLIYEATTQVRDITTKLPGTKLGDTSLIEAAQINANSVAMVNDTRRESIMFLLGMSALTNAGRIDQEGNYVYVKNTGEASQKYPDIFKIGQTKYESLKSEKERLYNAAKRAAEANMDKKAQRLKKLADSYDPKAILDIEREKLIGIMEAAGRYKDKNYLTFAMQALTGRLHAQQTLYNPQAHKIIRFIIGGNNKFQFRADGTSELEKTYKEVLYAHLFEKPFKKEKGFAIPRDERIKGFDAEKGKALYNKYLRWGIQLQQLVDNFNTQKAKDSLTAFKAVKSQDQMNKVKIDMFRNFGGDPILDAELKNWLTGYEEEAIIQADYLMDLAKYDSAVKNKGLHTTTIVTEIDGKTHGPATMAATLGNMQMARRSGILMDQDFTQMLATRDFQDLRDAMAFHMRDKLKTIFAKPGGAANNQFSVYENLLEMAIDDRENFLKQSPMTMGYGQEIPSLIDHVDTTIFLNKDIGRLLNKNKISYNKAADFLHTMLVDSIYETFDPMTIQASKLMKGNAYASAITNEVISISQPWGGLSTIAGAESFQEEFKTYYRLPATKRAIQKTVTHYGRKTSPSAARGMAGGDYEILGGWTTGRIMPALVQPYDANMIARTMSGPSWNRITEAAKSYGAQSAFVLPIFDAFMVDLGTLTAVREEANKHHKESMINHDYSEKIARDWYQQFKANINAIDDNEQINIKQEGGPHKFLFNLIGDPKKKNIRNLFKRVKKYPRLFNVKQWMEATEQQAKVDANGVYKEIEKIIGTKEIINVETISGKQYKQILKVLLFDKQGLGLDERNAALLKEIGKKRSELIPLLKSFKSNNIDLAV